jgi:hypothetical protein
MAECSDQDRNQQRVKCSGEQVMNTSRVGSTPKIPTNHSAIRALPALASAKSVMACSGQYVAHAHSAFV